MQELKSHHRQFAEALGEDGLKWGKIMIKTLEYVCGQSIEEIDEPLKPFNQLNHRWEFLPFAKSNCPELASRQANEPCDYNH